MKKLLSSIPSTRPDLFTYNYQEESYYKYFSCLSSIISKMNQIRSFRPYLLRRDMNEIYHQHSDLLQDLLDVHNDDRFWQICNNDKDECMLQTDQINFLVQILTKLNKNKFQSADNQQINSYVQLDELTKWLQEKIVKYEKQQSLCMKELIIKKKEQQLGSIKQQYQQYKHNIIDKLKKQEKEFKIKFKKQKQKQTQNYKKEVDKNIEIYNYKFKASNNLNRVKDISLLKKLSPYNKHKKSIYNNSQLKKILSKTIGLEQQRIQNMKYNYNKNQNNKLNRKQLLEQNYLEQKLASNRRKIENKLKNSQEIIHKGHTIKIKNLNNQQYKTNYYRNTSLKKSLQAYSQRIETKRIQSVLENHRYNVQFINDVNKVNQVNSQLKQLPSPYQTLQYNISKLQQKRKQEKRVNQYQKKILKGIQNNQTKLEQIEQQSIPRRKSLVDLYNNKMEKRQ